MPNPKTQAQAHSDCPMCANCGHCKYDHVSGDCMECDREGEAACKYRPVAKPTQATPGPCDTVKHVSIEDWERACIEAAKRAAFDADPRTKAARKAYKQARVLGVPEREAWEACSAELAKVRSSLDQRECDGEFLP